MIPQTLAGKMVRAVALRDTRSMQELSAALQASMWVGAAAVFDEAFAMAVTRRFSDVDTRLISRWLIAVADQRDIHDKLPVMEAEAMIRRILGENIDISDIHGRVNTTIQLFVIEAVGVDLRWTVDDVDAFAAEAELRAQQRGARPAVG